MHQLWNDGNLVIMPITICVPNVMAYNIDEQICDGCVVASLAPCILCELYRSFQNVGSMDIRHGTYLYSDSASHLHLSWNGTLQLLACITSDGHWMSRDVERPCCKREPTLHAHWKNLPCADMGFGPWTCAHVMEQNQHTHWLTTVHN